MIGAVLFDIDGTLLDHERASLASLRAALERERPRMSDDHHAAAVVEWRRLEELHYHEYLRGEIALEEQRRRRAGGILRWLGEPARAAAELDAWFGSFLDGYRQRWTLFEDVEPVVAELEARRLALGVITNADARLQRRKLAALGIAQRLPTFVASSEVGSPKPDRTIFETACARLGLPPERVAYVGDRLDTDARGARDAGLLGIWLDRAQRRSPDGAVGAAGDPPVIDTLAAIPGLLDRLADAVAGRPAASGVRV